MGAWYLDVPCQQNAETPVFLPFAYQGPTEVCGRLLIFFLSAAWWPKLPPSFMLLVLESSSRLMILAFLRYYRHKSSHVVLSSHRAPFWILGNRSSTRSSLFHPLFVPKPIQGLKLSQGGQHRQTRLPQSQQRREVHAGSEQGARRGRRRRPWER
jgi:hypothetical protein